MSQVNFNTSKFPSFKSRIVDNEEFKAAQYCVKNSSVDNQELESFHRALKAIKDDGKNDTIEFKHVQDTDRYQVFVNGEKKEDRAICLHKGNAIIRAIIRYTTHNKELPPIDNQKNLINELEQKLQELKKAYYLNLTTQATELCEDIKISE